jgi:hypothetical protein
MSTPGRYYQRLTPKYPTEKAQVAKLNLRRHLLTDDEVQEIANDPDSGIAREMAHAELDRRAGLTAHERIAEAAARRRASAC